MKMQKKQANDRSQVAFVFDRVMHYHIPTLRAVESRLDELGIGMTVLSAQDKAGATGRVASQEKAVRDHEQFTLWEKQVHGFMLRYQKGLLRQLKAAPPAVTVSMCHPGTLSEWAMLRWAHSVGSRCVAWQCGYEYNPGRVKRVVQARFMPLFDFHLCYHTNAQKYAICHGAQPSNTLVMHNTIDESRIVAGDKAHAKSLLVQRHPNLRGKRMVLYVGAVLAEKNLELVFEALDLLQQPDTMFVVVGDGPHLQVLKSKYSHRADWLSTGTVIDGVGPYFDAADVFVLPGTGGLAINEAMAHRLAVISGYADGSADDLVVDGETGYRLQPESAPALKECIAKVLRDDETARRFGERAEERIRGKLAFARFIDKVVGVLVEQVRLAKIGKLPN